MITLRVSRDSWGNCFNHTYVHHGLRLGSKTKEYLSDTYGIEHWEKIDLDQYRIRFSNETKMSLWILKWL